MDILFVFFNIERNAMDNNDFLRFVNFAKKEFNNIFDEPVKKFYSDMKKNIKILSQDMQKLISPKKQMVKLYNDESELNEKELKDTSFEREKQKFENYYKTSKKYQEASNQIKAKFDDPEAANMLSQMSDMEKTSKEIAEEAGGDLNELEKMFNGTLKDILNGTKDFDSAMKSLVGNLENYFIETFTNAITKGLFDSTLGSLVSNAMGSITGFVSSSTTAGTKGIMNVIGNIFGIHHSGGYIPSGTGTIPGTSEYISVLKGGERVLSPAENADYSNNDTTEQGKVVVNNFNVKAWDSKDVKKYLLENKNLLANITYENIKNNNSSLRSMIGGL